MDDEKIIIIYEPIYPDGKLIMLIKTFNAIITNLQFNRIQTNIDTYTSQWVEEQICSKINTNLHGNI